MEIVETLNVTDEIVKGLRASLLKYPEIFPVTTDLELCSRIISIGLAQEVGTENDELARFIFDRSSGSLVDRSSLQADVVTWRGKIGVRITSQISNRLEVRINGFRDLCHPELGENSDGTFSTITIFPEITAKIAALQGIELVIVRAWALNSIFGRFDKRKAYYETNFWELENNDTLLFARLLVERKLAFLGTHDLIAHIAGLKGEVWPELNVSANRVINAIRLFIGRAQASIPDLVLPYTAGVILDDLAQPPSYLSPSHQLMLDQVISAMEAPRTSVANAILLKYPSIFEEVIMQSRSRTLSLERASNTVARLVQQIEQNTAHVA